jgi:hypothetical protein
MHSMNWKFQPIRAEQFEHFRREWDALNQAGHSHVLLDSSFVHPLLRYFASDEVYLGRNANSGRPGMALVRRKTPGVWESFQPSQAPLGLVVFAKQLGPQGDELQDLLRSLPGFAVQVGLTQQDPDYTAFPGNLPPDRFEYVEHIATPRLILRGGFEEYWTSRSKKLRENLARYRRRLKALGHDPTLRVLTAPEAMAGAVREHARLESTGWKGKEGSAIREDDAQGHFYRSVLENFATRNEAIVFQLLAKETVFASRLAILRKNMLVMLKTAYDEGFAQCSPGMLLMEELVRYLWKLPEPPVIEFYGKATEWHSHWTEQSRQLFHLNCFRNALVEKARTLLRRSR